MALPTVTSTFAGKSAGFYISAALKEANSLNFMTSMENVKYKAVIQKLESGAEMADSTCDFTTAGTLVLTEAIITPKDLQVNMEICSKNLIDSWEALEMRAGAGAPAPASFDDYLISHLAGRISQGVENAIWSGNDATGGSFTGLTTATVGRLVVDATVVDVPNAGGAGTAYSATNIIGNLQAATAAIPSNVYTKEDLYIYMSPKSYRLYISAISALGYVNAYSMNGDYDAVFEGIKLAVCNGAEDDKLVCAEKSNLFFGTDLLSDSTNIQLLDQSAVGSLNTRLIARFTGGTQVGIGADVVFVS
tara:strand:- start:3072 stop:3986 length:915 start_codon:yes stop_codon:yes gene_type:complete